MKLSIQDLEAAINYWRLRSPSTGEEQKLSPEVNALAKPYASLIMGGQAQIETDGLDKAARDALIAWKSAQASSPADARLK